MIASVKQLLRIMRTFKPIVLFSLTLVCANAFAGPPAYDGRTPMIELGPMWLDPATTAEEQASIAQSLAQAQANNLAAYGQRLGSPKVVWCKTLECAAFFAGTDGRSHATQGNGKPRRGAQYGFPFPAIVITPQHKSKSDTATNVFTHELSHIELRARLHGASIPAWFNEGVATYLGGGQDCRLKVRGIDDLFELETGAQWLDYTNRGNPTKARTYCQASREVGAWIEEHGGFAAVLHLLNRRAAGAAFYSLYGRRQQLITAPAVQSAARATGLDVPE
jgi:hypothetical protein